MSHPLVCSNEMSIFHVGVERTDICKCTAYSPLPPLHTDTVSTLCTSVACPKNHTFLPGGACQMMRCGSELILITASYSTEAVISQADASMKAGKWDRNKYVGVSIIGKTLAVMGFGKVRYV